MSKLSGYICILLLAGGLTASVDAQFTSYSTSRPKGVPVAAGRRQSYPPQFYTPTAGPQSAAARLPDVGAPSAPHFSPSHSDFQSPHGYRSAPQSNLPPQQGFSPSLPQQVNHLPQQGYLPIQQRLVSQTRPVAVNNGLYRPHQVVPQIGRGPAAQSMAAQNEPQSGVLFSPAQVVAIVGDQTILAGDLMGRINQVMEENADKLTGTNLRQQKLQLMRELLEQTIETKLVYHDFLREVPEERLPDIKKNIRKEFDRLQLVEMMDKAGVKSPAELDAYLRKYGASLAKERRFFGERALAASMIRRKVNFDKEISHEDMLSFYNDNLKKYEYSAKARWEQLSAEFANYQFREQAEAAICAMGNQVLWGAPLAAVARKSEQGPQSSDGGMHDWTSKGSLRSETLDRAIFTLPPGRLSQVIADETGYHIVRVVERHGAGRISFHEAQQEIKKEIDKKNRRGAVDRYVAQIRENTRVWSIFNDPDAIERLKGLTTASGGSGSQLQR